MEIEVIVRIFIRKYHERVTCGICGEDLPSRVKLRSHKLNVHRGAKKNVRPGRVMRCSVASMLDPDIICFVFKVDISCQLNAIRCHSCRNQSPEEEEKGN